MIQYVETGLPEEEHQAEQIEEPKEVKQPSKLKKAMKISVPKKAIVIPLVIIVVLLILGGIFYLLYNHLYIYINGEHLLVKRYSDYNQIVDKGDCFKAYGFLDSATKGKISSRLYSYVCQQRSEYYLEQYISDSSPEIDVSISDNKGIIKAKRFIQDEEKGQLEYVESYIFVLEKGNWHRNFSDSQINFYYQEVVNGKNKVFLDCLVSENEREREKWLAEGQPQDWRYLVNDQGEIEYDLDAGADHFGELCAQRADNSEPGQIMRESGIN